MAARGSRYPHVAPVLIRSHRRWRSTAPRVASLPAAAPRSDLDHETRVLMSVRVAVNGLGRTGRSFLRSAYARQADAATLAYLLKYDSVGGGFPGDVRAASDGLVIDGRSVPAFSAREPRELPWDELDVDVVIESTGRF